MNDTTLATETCAECGRLTMIENKAPPIMPGPIPIVPVPPTPASQTTCDRCGKALAPNQPPLDD